jgi:hypothetical protein
MNKRLFFMKPPSSDIFYSSTKETKTPNSKVESCDRHHIQAKHKIFSVCYSKNKVLTILMVMKQQVTCSQHWGVSPLDGFSSKEERINICNDEKTMFFNVGFLQQKATAMAVVSSRNFK